MHRIKFVTALVVVMASGTGACASDDRAPDSSASDGGATEEGSQLEDNDDTTLREVADGADLRVGAAVAPGPLADDPGYAEAAATHFNALTPENELKWTVVQPQRGEWNFAPADSLVDFAEQHDMSVRGTSLVWGQVAGNGTPGWVGEIHDPAELRAVLRDWIATSMSRYAGRVDRWDVVNEPFVVTGGQLDPNHFFGVLGPGYIAEAFELAHEADPEAELWLNEIGAEYIPGKGDALVALVAELVDRDVPIHGVGLQAHKFPGLRLQPGALQDLAERLTNLGVDVAVTELDLAVSADRDFEAQAEGYRQIVGECLAAGCSEVTVWGVDDSRSWLDLDLGLFVDLPHPAEPLLLDRHYQPKPAYYAVRDAIATAAAS
jgi:endo-1,4-beta-xylanase